MRHENIDDHQIETGVFKGAKPGLAAIGDGHLKIMSFKIDLNGHTDHRIIVDDENTLHVSPQWRHLDDGPPGGGTTVEVAMVGRDSVFGASAALDGGISLAEAIVVLPGTAAILNIADFRAAAERSAALRALIARHEQALFAQALQSVACNASHTVEARLSRWLLRVRDLSDSETLPLTQEFLAQMIGVQRNAVSIVAHALQQAGMIRYSRGHIEIKDAGRLAETACECYRAVAAKRDRLLKPPD